MTIGTRVIPRRFTGPSDEDLVMQGMMGHVVNHPATVIAVRGRAVRIQSDVGEENCPWWWPISHIEVERRTAEELALSAKFREYLEP